jgi:periplasmic divalent cation tolerance protein
MIELIQVITTTPDRAVANSIAQELVAKRLAACVQVSGPITSTYRWQGKIEAAEEWVCTGKCRQEHFAAIESAIGRLHPYDVPEIVALPIAAGSQQYLDWLVGETDQPS